MQALSWRCPPDLGAIDQKLAELAVASANGAITTDVVRAVTPASREERVWSVVAAVAERRPLEALALLGQVLAQGENPVGVLTLLTGQVRELATARRAVQDGKPSLLGTGGEQTAAPNSHR